MSPKNKHAGEIVIEIKIPVVTNKEQAREVIAKLLEPIDETRAEALADEYQIQAYRGEYGAGGQTYYPVGTNAEDNYLERIVSEYGIDVDKDGNITQGVWVSSSEMC